MDDKKQDCKYWDKCYQRNAEHREKYNHPTVTVATASSPSRKDTTPEPESSSSHRRSPRKRSPRTVGSEQEGDLKKSRKSPARSPSPNKESPKGEKASSLQVPDSKTSPRKHKSPSKRPLSPNVVATTDSESASKEPPQTSTSCEKGKEGAAETDVSPTKQSTSAPKVERKEMDITKEYNEVVRNLSGRPQFEPEAIRYSQKAEYQELLKDSALFIRHMFLVTMPPDFYKFWEYCEKIVNSGQKPIAVFDKIGLQLVGPFDCLAGNFDRAKITEPGVYLRHWRFYYDPPEFQTVFVKRNTEIHYGYWRDDPKDSSEILMARNDASKGCEFEFVGGNCFETLLYYMEHDAGLTPFNSQIATGFRKSLKQFAQENEISLSSLKELKKKRDRNVVCKTFHRAGIVVPFDRKTEVGYRGLIESEAKLKKILSRFELAKGDKKAIASIMEELQMFITAANIAVDECDFGTAIELGIDLFCSGYKELHSVVNGLLVTGYKMVDRPQFIAIMKTHLERRDRGSDLSML